MGRGITYGARGRVEEVGEVVRESGGEGGGRGTLKGKRVSGGFVRGKERKKNISKTQITTKRAKDGDGRLGWVRKWMVRREREGKMNQEDKVLQEGNKRSLRPVCHHLSSLPQV